MNRTSWQQNARYTLLSFIILFLAVGTIGCAGFSGNQLDNLDQLQPAEKPVADEVEFRLEWNINGKPVSGIKKTILEEQENIARDIVAESGLFGNIYSGKYKQAEEQPAYVLKYTVNNHGNDALAFLSGFVSGFTFTIIPGISVDHWTLDAELTSPAGEVTWTGTYEDKMTGVIWLPMTVVMFSEQYNLFKVPLSILKNMYRHPLKEIRESGILETPPVEKASQASPSVQQSGRAGPVSLD